MSIKGFNTKRMAIRLNRSESAIEQKISSILKSKRVNKG